MELFGWVEWPVRAAPAVPNVEWWGDGTRARFVNRLDHTDAKKQGAHK